MSIPRGCATIASDEFDSVTAHTEQECFEYRMPWLDQRARIQCKNRHYRQAVGPSQCIKAYRQALGPSVYVKAYRQAGWPICVCEGI